MNTNTKKALEVFKQILVYLNSKLVGESKLEIQLVNLNAAELSVTHSEWVFDLKDCSDKFYQEIIQPEMRLCAEQLSQLWNENIVFMVSPAAEACLRLSFRVPFRYLEELVLRTSVRELIEAEAMPTIGTRVIELALRHPTAFTTFPTIPIVPLLEQENVDGQKNGG